MLAVFSIHTYVNIRTTSSNLTESVYASADRASDLIARSTRYGMLLNRKEDVHQIINTIGSLPGVVDINIYNKGGEIIFSTDSLQTGHQVDLDAEACNICHATGTALVSVPAESRMRVYESPSNGHTLGLINPIRNEPACYNASCHAHDPGQNVLGVLDVRMSLASVDAQVAGMRRSMIISSFAMMLLIAGTSAAFIYRVIRKPIRQLNRGMRTISAGNLNAKIEVDTGTEIGDLAGSFNNMALDLKQARDELREWTHTLEDRVDAKTEELQKVQAHVVHMDKMASLGKLSASVAHEINNPLFGILTYAKLMLRQLEDGNIERPLFEKQLEAIRSESSRCGDIVKNLLDFARTTGGEFTSHSLNDTVEQVLFLLNHHFEMRQITVTKDLMTGDDRLICDGKQLQQAIMAPCINSVEAMSTGGSLTLTTSGDRETVTIDITDTGGGIPEDVIPKVFEPFFTTKEGEAGLGLGLSVVYGIVQRHQGTIDIKSGESSTTLSIRLPREPDIELHENKDEKVML